MKVLIEKWIEKDANEQDIEKSLYLESDEFQFIIKKYNGRTTTDKNGRTTDQSEISGYFTNVQFALAKLLKMKIKQSTADNLEQLLVDIKRIEQEIKRVWSAEVDGQSVAV